MPKKFINFIKLIDLYFKNVYTIYRENCIDMKNKKWILIVSAVACFVLAGVIIAIGISGGQDTHIHGVTEAREYHIGGEKVYYTKACRCGEYAEDTDIDLEPDEVFAALTAQDSVILDGDVALSNSIVLNGYTGGANSMPKNITVNLNLNGYTLTSNSLDDTDTALFSMNSASGQIELNIKNGKLNGGELKYIFNCVASEADGELELNLNNVQCEVAGVNSSTLFTNENVKSSKIVANNCSFKATAQTESNAPASYGVLIDGNGEFTFNNCTFEGGDAVYVRRGEVTLTDCSLVSRSAPDARSIGDETIPMGACLVLNSRTNTTGQSGYNVTLNNCNFDGAPEVGAQSAQKQAIIIGNSGEGSQNNDCRLQINACRLFVFEPSILTEIPSLNVSECKSTQETINGEQETFYLVNANN